MGGSAVPVPNRPHDTTPLPRPDPVLLAAFWDALAKPGDVHEVRITDSRRGPAGLFGTVAGYFSEREAFVQALRRITGQDAAAVYSTLNPVDPKLQARADNRLEIRMKSTASDDVVVARRHLLIDVDPGIPAGISATDAERDAALAKRDAIHAFLDDLGWRDPVCVGMSGNGGSLIYRIDLPNAPTGDAPNAAAESLALVTACLEALASMFGVADEKAGRPGIDRSVANAARITKVIGTVAAKGDDCPHLGRPWRLATAEFHHDAAVVPRTLLEALAAHARVEEVASEGKDGRGLFGRATDHPERRWTVAELLARNGIGWTERRRPYGTAYRLDRCLTSSDHLDGASIIENSAGRLGHVCHHNRCQGKTWRDVRPALGLHNSGAYPSGSTRGDGAFSAFSASSAGGADKAGALLGVPPFPVEVFPASIRRLVRASAAWLRRGLRRSACRPT